MTCYILYCWNAHMQVMDEIVLRTAKAMVSEGIPFRGVLFAGLMIKNGKVSFPL